MFPDREYFFNFEKMRYIANNAIQKTAVPHRIESADDQCVLCSIVQGRASPDLVVYRGTGFVVVVNLYPYNPGHVMVVPVRHVCDLRDFTAQEYGELAELTRLALDAIDRTHRPHAYNVGFNMGHAAGASIAHIHQHIIPRYPNELGMADLIAGKRVLVEHPIVTRDRLRQSFVERVGITDSGLPKTSDGF